MSLHTKFVRVADPDHRALIAEHYRLDLRDIGFMACAMQDPLIGTPQPREILVQTDEQARIYHLSVVTHGKKADDGFEDSRDFRCSWLVRDGMIAPARAIEDSVTLGMANRALQVFYAPRMVLSRHFGLNGIPHETMDAIDLAVTETARMARENGHKFFVELDRPDLWLASRPSADAPEPVAFRHRGRSLSVATDIAAVLASMAGTIEDMMNDETDRVGVAGDRIMRCTITPDGVIDIHFERGRCLFAVDPDRQPAPRPMADDAPVPAA